MFKVFSRIKIESRDISDREWERMTNQERIMYVTKNPNSRFAKKEKIKNPQKQKQKISFFGFSNEDLDEQFGYKKLRYDIYSPDPRVLTFVNSKGEEPVTIEMGVNITVWSGIGHQQSKRFNDYDENLFKYVKSLLQKYK